MASIYDREHVKDKYLPEIKATYTGFMRDEKPDGEGVLTPMTMEENMMVGLKMVCMMDMVY